MVKAENPKTPNPWMILSFLLLGLLGLKILSDIIPGTDIIKSKFQSTNQTVTPAQPSFQSSSNTGQANIAKLSGEVLPSQGVELPIVWGDLGKQMIDLGVIDQVKFEQLFSQGGRSLSPEDQKILKGAGNGSIRMTSQNANFLLDMFWAFGLANKNDVLDKGEMMRDPTKVGNFASTGGWTLAKGEATNYYSKFRLAPLTAGQQALVESVSKGIYRPCCGNSTHFPDCNHGMAMLGLLELMAANGATEEQMYKTALSVNSFWFSQTYLDLAEYYSELGISWDKVDPKEVLGASYSSAQGYQQIRSKIKSLPQPQQGGGSCGA